MARDRTIPERVADWQQAYEAVRAELTPEALRALLNGLLAVEGAVENLAFLTKLADIIMQQDGRAAMVAENMTRNGLGRTVD